MKQTIILILLACGLTACSALSQGPTAVPTDALATSVSGTVAAAMTAGAGSTAAAAPSATMVPTLAPQASNTPEPTATAVVNNPTPAASATPATPDPNKDVGNEVYNDSFDGKTGWFWTFSDDKAEFGAKDGELKVTTKAGDNTWRYVVRDDISAGDQQLRVTTKTGTCPGNDEYGVMYRAAYMANQKLETYIYKLNCAGQARVEILNDTTTTVLKDWESFPAIKSGASAENTLMIWMEKDQFNFYANDQYLFSLTDATLPQGFYGFYVQSHSGGGGDLSFDDFVVKEVAAAAR